MESSKSRKKIAAGDVEIDRFRLEDVEPFVSYWHDTPSEFWLRIGADKKLFRPRDEMEASLRDFAAKSSKGTCTVVYQGQRIGAHPLTDVEEKKAMMHSHFWDQKYRGLGIAPVSYVKAMDWLIRENSLELIYFFTPKINPGPNRVKEKLGIPVIGEAVLDKPILIQPQPAWHSEVSKEDLPELYRRLETICS